ncbi:hypothetical protein R3P38DRAFT_1479360 [Favolaschia claudopus]|uniref:Uncharacterized protein n=1 Tax=Favolaschia claudopus TaxID=2862362 RepID=A0AAW0DT67_9AGAR
MSGQRLTHREMLSYGFKPGEPWAQQRRDLERAFDRGAAASPSRHSSGHRSLSMSSSGGLPGLALTSLRVPTSSVSQRQNSTASTGAYDYGYGRWHSGYGHGPEYIAPGHNSPPRMISPQRTPAPSPTSSRPPAHPFSMARDGRANSSGYYSYNPSSTLSSPRLNEATRYGGYEYSEPSDYSSTRPFYDTEDEEYAIRNSGFASGYGEAAFVIEPSDSGSEDSGSRAHDFDNVYGSGSERSGSSLEYSGSESEGVSVVEEYDDYEDAGGSYSDDGYCSDDDAGGFDSD